MGEEFGLLHAVAVDGCGSVERHHVGGSVAVGVGFGQTLKYLVGFLNLAFGLFVFAALAVQECYVIEQASEQLHVGYVLAFGLLGQEVEGGCGRMGRAVHVGQFDFESRDDLHECCMQVE